MNTPQSVRAILLRELKALKRELEAYPDERVIWSTPPGIANSACTLALHLAGNLQAFIGAALGNSGYRRNRQAEFERREVPRAELLAEIDRAIEAVDATLPRLDDERMAAPFPIEFGTLQVTTGDFLIHLATHLAFHLGQVDYHRRLSTGDSRSASPVAIAELASAVTRE
jgi:uncharacterized damage-inducible protein DinB